MNMPNIIVNTEEWTTPKKLAEKWGVSKQVVNNWVRRGRAERKKVDELDLILVRIVHKKQKPKKEKDIGV